LVPTPYFGEEMGHVDAFGAHFYHPGVFEHAPGGGAAGGIFFEAGEKKISIDLMLGMKRDDRKAERREWGRRRRKEEKGHTSIQ